MPKKYVIQYGPGGSLIEVWMQGVATVRQILERALQDRKIALPVPLEDLSFQDLQTRKKLEIDAEVANEKILITGSGK